MEATRPHRSNHGLCSGWFSQEITRRYKKPVRETGIKGKNQNYKQLTWRNKIDGGAKKKKICCFCSGKETEVHELEREIYS